jgi:hypothetical protein
MCKIEMKIHILEIPESHASLASWIENQLVGDSFGDMITEIVAIHGDTSAVQLDHFLLDCQEQVLEHGLVVMPHERLKGLLGNARMLAELQELVIRDGGQYWQEIIDKCWSTKEHNYGKPDFDCLTRNNPSYLTDLASRKPATHLQRRVFQVVSIAAVFLMLITAGKYLLESSPELDSWGWNSLELAAINGDSTTYLETLGDSANEWFAVRPNTKQELATRIIEFRLGCNKLILAEHRQLSKSQQTQLRLKCQLWAKDIDNALVDLESGASLQVVRNRMDSLIRRLTQALHQPTIT